MKIFCIGRNYSEHIHELGNEKPDDMVIFLKPHTAIHPLVDPWYIPEFSNEIHYECEIVLKISKNGKYIPHHLAENYYQEISLGIDFTARDIQNKLKSKGLPWERAKAFDRSAVVGRFFPKEHYDTSSLNFYLEKNKSVVQKGNSSQMIYSFSDIISEISKYFTLQTGDIVYTGTPAGVGAVAPSDLLEGYLEGESVFSLRIS